MLTRGMWVWLDRLRTKGTWPERPFLHDRENSIPLMQQGLVEVIKPPAPHLSYARITAAGRDALKANPNY